MRKLLRQAGALGAAARRPAHPGALIGLAAKTPDSIMRRGESLGQLPNGCAFALRVRLRAGACLAVPRQAAAQREPDAMVGEWIAMCAVSKPLVLGGLLLGLGACTTALPPEKTDGDRAAVQREIKQGTCGSPRPRRAPTDFRDWYPLPQPRRAPRCWATRSGRTRSEPDRAAGPAGRGDRAARAPAARARRRRADAAPVDTAAAQTNFDCWLEELEATKDPDQRQRLQGELRAPRWPRPSSPLIETPYLVSSTPAATGSTRSGWTS